MPARRLTGQAYHEAAAGWLGGFFLGANFGPAGALRGGDTAASADRHDALATGCGGGNRGAFLLRAHLSPAGALRDRNAATGAGGERAASCGTGSDWHSLRAAAAQSAQSCNRGIDAIELVL